jgi:hypothetical protein
MDAVLVEIAPPESSREHQESLLRACRVAAKPLRCVAGEAGDEPPALLAIVAWDAEGNARIEVGVRREKRVEWAERRLTFAAGDPEKQRWEAAGLAAGTVAAALSQTNAPAPAAEKQAPAPETQRSEPLHLNDESAEPSGAPASWGVDLGLVAASGFGGSVRAGGSLGVRYAPAGALRVELRGSLAGDSHAVSSGASLVEVSTLASRVGALAGAGFDVGLGELGVLGGPFVEHLHVEVEREGGQATRVLGGAELTVEFRVRFAEHFLAFLAADAGSRFGSTFVAIDGMTVGRLPPPFVGARVGVEMRF